MAPSKTVFQLPTMPSWLENIAVRASGTVLTTRVDAPELWEINPQTHESKVLLTIPEVGGLTGINELEPDVWAIGGGVYDLAAGSPVAGSFGLWIADLRGDAEPSVRLLTKMPEIGLLNGTVTWDASTMLAADSVNGKIYKIDVASGAYSVALADEALTVSEGAPVPIGVNGIKVHAGHVYFTNTARGLLARVPVDATTIAATGPVEVLATNLTPDDFDLAKDGTVYVTTHPTNLVVRVAPGGGEPARVAGDYQSMEVAGATACVLGRTESDKNVLYVCTSGALIAPVNGMIEAGKVVAIELDG